MNYTQEMNLQSKSGYCMPFEERKGEVRMSLDYGTQVHPKSGEEFFHHGIDFITKHYLLSACLAFAAGLVAIYLLSVTWVFGTRKLENPALEFLIFLGIGMAGLVLNALIMFVATGWIGMHYLVSKATSTGFVFLFNYFLRSSLLFNKKPSAQPNHIT